MLAWQIYKDGHKLGNVIIRENDVIPKILSDLKENNRCVISYSNAFKVVGFSGKTRLIKKFCLDDFIILVDEDGNEFYRVEREKLK